MSLQGHASHLQYTSYQPDWDCNRMRCIEDQPVKCFLDFLSKWILTDLNGNVLEKAYSNIRTFQNVVDAWDSSHFFSFFFWRRFYSFVNPLAAGETRIRYEEMAADLLQTYNIDEKFGCTRYIQVFFKVVRLFIFSFFHHLRWFRKVFERLL